MPETVTVLMVRTGQTPMPADIGRELEDLYRVLGCTTVECVPIGGGYTIWCDEEEALNGKPFNSCGILGDYFIARADDEGELRSLTPEEVRAATNYWRAYRHRPHPAGGAVLVTGEDARDVFARLERGAASLDDDFKNAQARAETKSDG